MKRLTQLMLLSLFVVSPLMAQINQVNIAVEGMY